MSERADPRETPSTLDAAAVLLGGLGLAAAVAGLFGYGWRAFDWTPLAGAAAALGPAALALAWDRASDRGQEARALGLAALALAYPPGVVVTGLVVGVAAVARSCGQAAASTRALQAADGA